MGCLHLFCKPSCLLKASPKMYYPFLRWQNKVSLHGLRTQPWNFTAQQVPSPSLWVITTRWLSFISSNADYLLPDRESPCTDDEKSEECDTDSDSSDHSVDRGSHNHN